MTNFYRALGNVSPPECLAATAENLPVSLVSSLYSSASLSGDDRVEFLHGQCTQDILALGPGDGCYAIPCATSRIFSMNCSQPNG